MDLKTTEEIGGAMIAEKSDCKESSTGSKVKGTGSLSNKDKIFRADKIDLKSLDIQLEKHLSRVWSRSIDSQRPKEEWEIDLSKLDIKHVVAHGTYGTVYQGTYDNQDVAGNHPLFHVSWIVLFSYLCLAALKADRKIKKLWSCITWSGCCKIPKILLNQKILLEASCSCCFPVFVF